MTRTEATPTEMSSRRTLAFSRKFSKSFKIMKIPSVEEVSEGFMQLVENCANGAAVIVYKVRLAWMGYATDLTF